MTPDETFELLQAVAAMADERNADPQDMLRLCGYLVTRTLNLFPPKQRQREFREWIKYARFVMELSEPTEAEPYYERRH